MVKKLLHGLKRPSNWLPVLPVLFFFWLVAGEVVSLNAVAILANGLDIGGAILLNFALIPAWVKVVRRAGYTPEAYLFGGLLMLVNSVALSRLWSLGIIMMGKPAWMINHWFQSFCYLMVGLAMFYLLKVAGNNEHGVFRYKYVAYGLAVAVMVMCVFLVYWE